MLQTMRNGAQGWIAKFLVIFMVLIFALWGVESLIPRNGQEVVAKVDGEKIYRKQLLQTMRNKRSMLINQAGANFNPALLDEKILEKVSMEELVNDTLIRQKISNLGIRVSEETVDKFIVNSPEFYIDNNFNYDKFASMISSIGMTISNFKRNLASELATSQFQMGIVTSNFMTQHEARRLNELYQQTRDVSWLTLKHEIAKKNVKVTESDIQKYYTQNKSLFKTPEMVKVQYILLDKKKLLEGIEISDDEIQRLYEERINEIKSQIDLASDLSIILFDKEKDSMSIEDRANQVFDKLNQGESFAAMAKLYSDDASSAKKGGNIGSVQPGFFGDSFDLAASSLKNNTFSKPIKTSFGIVIIYKEDSNPIKLPSLSELKPEIVATLKNNAVNIVFSEKSQQLADLSFESSDLTAPAEKLNLPIEKTDFFSRMGGEGLASDPKVIAAAFSEDVLIGDLNSEAIELSPDRVLVLHLDSHKVSRLKPLETVTSDIKLTLTTQKAQSLQKEESKTIIAQLNDQNGSPSATSTVFPLQWKNKKDLGRDDTEYEPNLVKSAFRLSLKHNKNYVAQMLNNHDVVIMRLDKINQPQESTALDRDLQNMAELNDAETQFSEILYYWKKNSDIRYLGRSQS